MKNERVEQIKASLAGLGTASNNQYTNQEIVDAYKELQAALARGVFEKTHAENLRDRDVLAHFMALAKEYGLEETPAFRRFRTNMADLSYIIATLITGLHGERLARRALKLLTCDPAVRVLYNIQLEDEDSSAECDAIVLAPWGIFVVEVKNWNTSVVIAPDGRLIGNGDSKIVYDLVGRLNTKEALLRKCLGADFPELYRNILMFTSEKTLVDDQYHRIPVVCGLGVSQKIRDFADSQPVLNNAQINALAERIRVHHKVQKTTPPVNCEEIIEDYAALMAMIEEASRDAAPEDACVVHTEPEDAAENRLPQDTAPEDADVVHTEPEDVAEIQLPQDHSIWRVAGTVLLWFGAATVTYLAGRRLKRW